MRRQKDKPGGVSSSKCGHAAAGSGAGCKVRSRRERPSGSKLHAIIGYRTRKCRVLRRSKKQREQKSESGSKSLSQSECDAHRSRSESRSHTEVDPLMSESLSYRENDAHRSRSESRSHTEVDPLMSESPSHREYDVYRLRSKSPSYRGYDAHRSRSPSFREYDDHRSESPSFREYDAHRSESPSFREYDAHMSGSESSLYREYDGHRLRSESPSYREYDAHRSESPSYREYDAHRSDSPSYREYDAHRSGSESRLYREYDGHRLRSESPSYREYDAYRFGSDSQSYRENQTSRSYSEYQTPRLSPVSRALNDGHRLREQSPPYRDYPDGRVSSEPRVQGEDTQARRSEPISPSLHDYPAQNIDSTALRLSLQPVYPDQTMERSGQSYYHDCHDNLPKRNYVSHSDRHSHTPESGFVSHHPYDSRMTQFESSPRQTYSHKTETESTSQCMHYPDTFGRKTPPGDANRGHVVGSESSSRDENGLHTPSECIAREPGLPVFSSAPKSDPTRVPAVPGRSKKKCQQKKATKNLRTAATIKVKPKAGTSSKAHSSAAASSSRTVSAKSESLDNTVSPKSAKVIKRAERRRNAQCVVPNCTYPTTYVKVHAFIHHVPEIFEEYLCPTDNRVIKGRHEALKMAAVWLFGKDATLEQLMSVIPMQGSKLNCQIVPKQDAAMRAMCRGLNWKEPTHFTFDPVNSPAVLIHWRPCVRICAQLRPAKQQQWRIMFALPQDENDSKTGDLSLNEQTGDSVARKSDPSCKSDFHLNNSRREMHTREPDMTSHTTPDPCLPREAFPVVVSQSQTIACPKTEMSSGSLSQIPAVSLEQTQCAAYMAKSQFIEALSKAERRCPVPGCTAVYTNFKLHAFEEHVPSIFDEFLVPTDDRVIQGRYEALKQAAAWILGRHASVEELRAHVCLQGMLAHTSLNLAQVEAMSAMCRGLNWQEPAEFTLHPMNSLALLIHWQPCMVICASLQPSQRDAWRAAFRDPPPALGEEMMAMSPEPAVQKQEAYNCHLHLERSRANLGLRWQASFQDILAAVDALEPSLKVIGSIVNFCDPLTFPSEAELDSLQDMKATVGIHPMHVQSTSDQEIAVLQQLLQHPKVFGLGEVGLDHRLPWTLWHRQLELLVKVLPLLQERHTLVLYCRGMDKDDGTEAMLLLLALVKKHVPETQKIHLHNFTGDQYVLTKWLDSFPNTYFGFSRMVSEFTDKQVKALQGVRVDRILLECDSPEVPTPSQVPSTPTYLRATAEIVAEKRGTLLEELLMATVLNSQLCYIA